MAISRAQQLKQMIPGLHALFGRDYKEYPQLWKGVYKVNKSNRSFEEETKLGGFRAAEVKNEGSPVAYDIAQEAWTARYTHETIALGYAVTEEAVEDNLYLSVAQRYTRLMAKSFAYTKNVKAAAVFNSGFDPAFPGGDNVPLFSTSHPLQNGAVNSNRPTTGVDLNETALEAAIIQIAQWTDERGLLINESVKKLVIPVQYDFVATRLLKSTLRSSVQAVAPTFAPNDVNAIYTMQAIPEGYMVWNFLTDPNAWYLTTTVNDTDGLKYFERVPLRLREQGDFDTGNFRQMGRERYSFGFSDPLCVYGSPGST